jgi:hypothetical protein
VIARVVVTKPNTATVPPTAGLLSIGGLSLDTSNGGGGVNRA